MNPHHAKDPNCVSTRAAVVNSLRQTSDCKEDSMQKRLRPGRTSRNVDIHRKNLVDAPQRRVVLAEYATTDSASTYRDDYLGLRHRPMRL